MTRAQKRRLCRLMHRRKAAALRNYFKQRGSWSPDPDVRVVYMHDIHRSPETRQ